MMRKSGSGDAELFLDFAGDQALGMGGQQEPENLETGLGAEGGEAVGGASDQKRIGLPHCSIIAEIWNDVKLFPLSTLAPAAASYWCASRALETVPFLAFDRVSAAWDTFCFRGSHEPL